MFKIRRIWFEDNPILGNLDIDFCDKNGKTVDTVIIAGENGCGKSTILECIYSVFSFTSNFKFDGIIEVENGDALEELNAQTVLSNNRNVVKMKVTDRKLSKQILDEYTFGENFKKHYKMGCIYSDVDINFNTQELRNVTSMDIDSEKVSRKSDSNLPTQIKQLLIDIKALDDASISDKVIKAQKNGEGEVNTSNLLCDRRMPRFENAFAQMFDGMNFKDVENENNHKVVYFKKNDVSVPLDKLSSGEKQIVFRGCFLLKDVNALNGAIVLIDEPEISLHPIWQKKIMDYYKEIFTNEAGVQTSQIFVVTHSPFIIHNANRMNDKVIVLSRDTQGNIIVKDKPEYYKCSSTEVIKDAFSINDFNENENTVFVEGETDELYFNKMIKVFGLDLPFKIQQIGHTDAVGKDISSGKDSMDKIAKFFEGKAHQGILVFLYDSDAKRPDKDGEKVYTRSLSEYANSKDITMGIENALVLDDAVDVATFHETKERPTGYGITSKIQSFRKKEFCNFINEKSNNELKVIFANLKKEVEKLVPLFQ